LTELDCKKLPPIDIHLGIKVVYGKQRVDIVAVHGGLPVTKVTDFSDFLL
jgi:hypothetical protein